MNIIYILMGFEILIPIFFFFFAFGRASNLWEDMGSSRVQRLMINVLLILRSQVIMSFSEEMN